MSTATFTEIVEQYMRKFSTFGTPADEERIGFLEMIVSGEIEANDEASKNAAQAVRKWYENPNTMPYQRMYARISESQWKQAFFSFKECTEVLKEKRLEELFGQYEQALQQRNHDAVNATERLIAGFDDKEAIEKMNELKRAYIATRRYKVPGPEGEMPWRYIAGIGLAAAAILALASWCAMSGYKPVPRTEHKIKMPDDEYLGKR
jgi:hypothetical protein